MDEKVSDRYRLIRGDAELLLDVVPAGAIAIVDPPYGSGRYQHDVRLSDGFWKRIIERQKTLAVFGFPEDLCGLSITLGRQPDEYITWYATNKTLTPKKDRLMRCQEGVAIFGDTPGVDKILRKRVRNPWTDKITVKRGHSLEYAREGDVWRDHAPGMSLFGKKRRHKNEKPVSLIMRLILLCARDGDVIADFCMGSGTTGEAALRLGHYFIGIEKDASTFEDAAVRIEQSLSQEVLDFGMTQPLATASAQASVR